MEKTLNIGNITSTLFALVLIALGIMNLVLVHAVPGKFYLLLSLFYLPLANNYVSRNFGLTIPTAAKFILGFGTI